MLEPVTFTLKVPSQKMRDTDTAKSYFQAMLTWQQAMLEATANSMDSDPDNDRDILIRSIGPVAPGDPANIMAIEYEEKLYENGLELVFAMMSRHTQLLEKSSRLVSDPNS